MAGGTGSLENFAIFIPFKSNRNKYIVREMNHDKVIEINEIELILIAGKLILMLD
jgi:hypothetical protein